MAGRRDEDVDPRFDPLFQRGYDPAQHRTRVKPSAPSPSRGEERREATGFETPAPPASPSPAPTLQISETPVPTEAEPEGEYEPPRRNPFRLALLLVSLAAIVGAGLVLWHRIQNDPYGGYGGYGGDVGKVFVQQMSDALLTPLLTGGVLGVCLWLALGALRRRDRG